MSELEQTSKKGNGGFVVVILLLLIGLGVLAYFLSDSNKQLDLCKNDNRVLNADMEGMNEMMSGYLGTMSNDMKTDFTNMLDTYDALLEKDKSQADSINAHKKRIVELQEEVKRGKMSAHQLFKARKEIETMKSIMRGYIVQIDSLNTLNLTLYNRVDSTNTALIVTKGERDQARNEADASAEQVKKGSKLQAYNFSSGGLKMKLNNSMTASTRARNTVQIQSSFTISENPIAPSGKKTVYMQIIDPDGKILQSSSGNYATMDTGQIAYSDYKEIDYQNQRVDMAIYYNMGGVSASKGNYKVNIYCQGQLIGTDSFTLK